MSDGFFDYVSLLLPFEGEDGSTNFIDYSPNGLVATANGNAQLDTAQNKFGGSSGLFDGTGDYLTVANTSTLIDHTQDWTVEFWLRIPSLPAASEQYALFASRDDTASNGIIMTLMDNGKLRFYGYNTVGTYTGDTSNDGAVTLSVDTWYHVAYVHDRSAPSVSIYVDGVFHDSATYTGTLSQGDTSFRIGAQNRALGDFELNGWLDDFRLTNGIARYTTAFTPPVAAHPIVDRLYKDVSLLLPFDGSIVDESSNALPITLLGTPAASAAQSKFGGSSLLCDNASAISIADTPLLEPGAEDFTIETWVYLPTGGTNTGIIYEKGAQSLTLFYGGSQELSWYISSTGSTWNVASDQRFATNPARDTWHHIAVSRVGSNIRGFFNGTLIQTVVSAAAVVSNADAVTIGGKSNLATTFDGYLDDFRFTKGTGRYTTSFTPPAIAHPIIAPEDAYYESNTLLVPFDGADASTTFTDSSLLALTLTPVGDAQIDTAQSKFGGSSGLFDGTGDYISVPNNTALIDVNSDFTLECWVRSTSLAIRNTIAGNSKESANDGWFLNIDTDGKLQFVAYNANSVIANITSTAGDIVTNTWYHIALVGAGGDIKIYTDGVEVASGTPSGAIGAGSTSFYIGRQERAIGNQFFNGHIDDFRITNGIARYTAAFIPPTGPAPVSPQLIEAPITTKLTGSGTYTVPLGVRYLRALVVGGGGGGASNQGGGGGAGGIVFEDNIPVIPGDTFSYAIGSGGSGGPSATRGNGTGGGNTTFGSYTATGGGFGGGQTGGTAGSGGSGGGGDGVSAGGTAGAGIVGQGHDGSDGPPGGGGGGAGTAGGFAGVLPRNGFGGTGRDFSNVFGTGYGESGWFAGGGGGGGSGGVTNVPGGLGGGGDGELTDPSNVVASSGLAETGGGGGAGTFNSLAGASGGSGTVIIEERGTKYLGDTPAPDYNFDKVSLLLDFEGADGSTTFTDYSSNSLTATSGGDVQIDTAQSKFGSSSGLFDGTGDYLNYQVASLQGDAPWTVECWVYPASNTGLTTLVHAQNGVTNQGIHFYIDSDTNLLKIDNGIAAGATGSISVPDATWTHLAAVFDGTNILGFVNGVLDIDSTAQSYSTSITNVLIGGFFNGGGAPTLNYAGHIDDLRITNGLARYTQEFQAPTGPFAQSLTTITKADNLFSLVDYLVPFENLAGAPVLDDFSTNNVTTTLFGGAQLTNNFSKYGTSSLFLDGVDSYLRADAALTSLSTNTDSFTIEGWFYQAGVLADSVFFGLNGTSDGNNILVVFNDGIVLNGGSKTAYTAVSTDQWNHIAITYDATNLTLWVNGVSHYTAPVGSFLVPLNQTVFGVGVEFDTSNGGTPGQYWRGYIDEVRVTAGTSRYSAPFTPETEAFALQGVVIPEVSVQDPYYDYVAALLKFDESLGSTTFADSSPWANTYTTAGNTVSTLDQQKWNSPSVYFDGTLDNVRASGQPELVIGSGDFCFEAWVYFTGVTNGDTSGTIACSETGSGTANYWQVFIQDDLAVGLQMRQSAQSFFISAAGTITLNQWHHIAAVRESSICNVFVDGVSVVTPASDGGKNIADNSLTIGMFDYTTFSNNFQGYMADVRFTIGTPRYTANFTPPTGPFLTERDDTVDPLYTTNTSLLLPFESVNDTAQFKDRSVDLVTTSVIGTPTVDTNYFKYGNSSALFGSATDSIDASLTGWGTSEFTLEFWYRATSYVGVTLVDTRQVAPTTEFVLYDNGGNGNLVFYTGGANRISSGASGYALNAWTHIAVARRAGVTRLFIDGVFIGSYTDSGNYDHTSIRIGNNLNPSSPTQGNIDDFRITNGSARYVTTFTPPTRSLPYTIEGLLEADPYFDFVTLHLPMHGADASTTFIDYSNAALGVTPVGDAQIDTAQFKNGLTSALFDGTGDYLSVTNSASLVDLNGECTLEAWVRLPTLPSIGATIFSNRTESPSNNGFQILVDSSGALQVTAFSGGSSILSGTAVTGLLSINTWHHVALVGDGTNVKVYSDGVEVFTGVPSVSIPVGSTNLSIGRMERAAGNLFWDGWIDDVRITNGVNRYTASFTPPALGFDTKRSETTDPFLSNVTSIVKFEDGNGSTTIADELNGTWVVSGTSTVTTAQAKQGTGSFLVNGTNGSLALTNPPVLDGDFTVEFWAAPVQAHQTSGRLLQLANGDVFSGFGLYPATTSENSNLLLYSSTNNSSWNAVGGVTVLTSPISDKFYHFAFSRTGSTCHLHVDGELAHSWTIAGTVLSGGTWVFGGQSSGPSRNSGYAFDEIRITDDVARYPQPYSAPLETYITTVFNGIYTLDVNSGNITLTGLSVDLVPPTTAAYTLDALTATFSLTGGNTLGAITYGLDVNSTLFATTDGSSVANRGFIINSESVAPEFNTLFSTVFIDYDQNQFPLDVNDVDFSSFGELVELVVERLLYANTASFTTTTGSSNMVLGYQLDGTTTTFPITGSTVTIDRTESKVINATSGSFSLAGSSVILEDILGALSTSFGLVGGSVSLAASRVLTQPTNTTVVEGAVATFTVLVEGSGSISYQWYEGVSPIAGATAASLSITTVLADTGNTYYVEVTDSVTTFTSSTVTLTVNAVPVITAQPTNQVATEGTNFTFTVTATGTGALSYQWYREGVILPGETAASLTSSADSNKDGYEYYVTITDDNATVQSNVVTLDVDLIPIIVIQPSSKTVFENNSVNFTVTATGENTLNYQWYNAVGDVLLGGETGSTLSISPAALTDNGNTYYVIISDSITATSVTSNTVTLTVNQQTLAITSQPTSTLVPEDAAQVIFTVSAVGSGVGQPTYQWYDASTDIAIPGETGATLTLTAPLIDRSSYYVVVADAVNVTGIQSNTVFLDLIIVGLYSFVLPEEFGNSTITVDRALTMDYNPNTYTTKLGEGYEQRVPMGLSNIDETYNITIKNRPPELIDRITTYFESLNNIEAFEFVISNQFQASSKETVQVICTDFTVVHNQVNSKSLQATFKKVYEKIPE